MTTPAPSFTPGPWEWHLSHDGVSLRTPNRGQLVIFDCGGRVTGHGLRFSKRHDRDRAGLMYFARELVPADQRNRTGFVTIDNPDARLIAASPALYAACKSAYVQLDYLRSLGLSLDGIYLGMAAEVNSRCDELAAALAQAEGK